MPIVQRRLSVMSRILCEIYAFVAHCGTTLDLDERSVDIPEWKRCDWNQSVWSLARLSR